MQQLPIIGGAARLLPRALPLLTAVVLGTLSPSILGAEQSDLPDTAGKVHTIPLRDGFTYDRGLNKHGIASLVDRETMARFAYYGTFWGDRPSIRQVLDMVRDAKYSFDAPRRLKPPGGTR
jgi:hypothetical protein